MVKPGFPRSLGKPWGPTPTLEEPGGFYLAARGLARLGSARPRFDSVELVPVLAAAVFALRARLVLAARRQEDASIRSRSLANGGNELMGGKEGGSGDLLGNHRWPFHVSCPAFQFGFQEKPKPSFWSRHKPILSFVSEKRLLSS